MFNFFPNFWTWCMPYFTWKIQSIRYRGSSPAWLTGYRTACTRDRRVITQWAGDRSVWWANVIGNLARAKRLRGEYRAEEVWCGLKDEGAARSQHISVMKNEAMYSLRWRTEWICSERPITMCAFCGGMDMPGVSDLASGWGHEGTRTNQGSYIIEITEKPDRQRVQRTNFGLLVGASLFRLTGWFHIHLFYLSNVFATRPAWRWQWTTVIGIKCFGQVSKENKGQKLEW